MYLLIDTETSSLPDYNRSADAAGQPRVASFAAIYLDGNLNVEREYTAYVQPDGWVMDPGATEVNGLTTEFLIEHGVPISLVLPIYIAAMNEGRAVIAYGAQFDCKMMRGELRLAGLPDMFYETPNACLMRTIQAHAKSIGTRIIKYDKQGNPQLNAKGWPKLSDVCRHYDVMVPPKPHEAILDARGTLAILRHMIAEGYVLNPTVHESKDLEAIRSNR